MVNNLDRVLDEGKIKYLDYIMKDPKYFSEFKDRVQQLQDLRRDINHNLWLFNQGYQGKDMYEEENKQLEKIKRLEQEYESKDEYLKGYVDKDLFRLKKSPEIAEYMGAMPFYPSVMINISPNWKGMQFNKLHTKAFEKVIESYLNEVIGDKPRYTKWKYCLECGSTGDFLHAHIVAQINPRVLPSMKSHLNRGNHKQQLMKYWDKYFKGNQGLLKGKFAVQRILINNEELLNDKLNYLLEENKMEGHKNARNLNLVFGDF